MNRMENNVWGNIFTNTVALMTCTDPSAMCPPPSCFLMHVIHGAGCDKCLRSEMEPQSPYKILETDDPQGEICACPLLIKEWFPDPIY